MAMRVIQELPPDLTRLLFELGPRKLVLVEGKDDRAVFREWYRDRLSEVEFFTPEVPQGGSGVQHMLTELLARSTNAPSREYGIIDRDFRDDAEVEAPLHDPQAHLFILRRYALENYLLEPSAVADQLRVLSGSDPASPDASAVEDTLLRLCQELRLMMAANWLCWDLQDGRYYQHGHSAVSRNDVLQKLIQDHGLSPKEAEERIMEKERLLDPLLASLETAHTRINGKHLLFRLYEPHNRAIRKDYFRNLLAERVKENGLHEDIRAIMERILT